MKLRNRFEEKKEKKKKKNMKNDTIFSFVSLNKIGISTWWITRHGVIMAML